MNNKLLLLRNNIKKEEYINKINNFDISRNKFTLIDYNEPEIKDMAIIIVFFNFTKSIRIIQNLLLIKNKLEMAKIPFYIGEIVFDNDNFLLNKADNIFQYRTNSYMFYKENLINVIEEQIPFSYTKILAMDADLLFDNPDWYSIASQTLDNFTICQGFNIATWLSLDFNILQTKESIVINKNHGHPGFIWGYNREWFKQYKLVDYTIIGGGDSILQFALFNLNFMLRFDYLENILTNYKNKIKDTFTISFIDINVYHLYHGNFSNRQYVDRHAIINTFIQENNLESIIDLVDINENKLYEWKPEYRDKLNLLLFTYFSIRDDDSL